MGAKKELENLIGEEFSFGMALEAYRTREGITQADLAELLGCGTSHVCNLEKGRTLVSAEKATEIARAIGDSEKFFVMLAFKDQLRKTGKNWEVKVA